MKFASKWACSVSLSQSGTVCGIRAVCYCTVSSVLGSTDTADCSDDGGWGGGLGAEEDLRGATVAECWMEVYVLEGGLGSTFRVWRSGRWL